MCLKIVLCEASVQNTILESS